MASVEITLDGSAAVLVCAAGVAVTAGFLFYRFTLPAVSTLTRLTLSLLRAGALGLIVFLVFAPALRLSTTGEERPLVALLVDGTRSMNLTDGGRARSVIIDSVLRGSAIGPLSEASRVATFSIGANLREVPSIDSIRFDAPVTDLGAAIEGIVQLHRRTPFSAILMLTDGAYTRGDNPVHAAERLGVPIIAVGIGDTTEGRDVLVARVASNSIVYEGAESPVDVTVRSSGANGERVEVRLLTEGRTLASAPIVLARGTREYTVRLTYIPEGAGVRTYTVSVSDLRNELTARNNRRTFFARVLKSKLKVLILAGAPSPDLATVRFTLSGIDRFSVSTCTQRPAGGWHGAPPSASALDSTDCAVFIGFPTASTPQTLLRDLAQSFLSRRTPVLFIGGRDVSYTGLRMLGELMPFTATLPSQTEQLIAVEPAAPERMNQLLTLSRPDGANAWKRLPPAYSTLTVFAPRPGATTLASVQTQGGLSGGPLILTRSVGGQKSLAVLAHGIWRWRLMAQGRPETATLLADFLTASLEWLTTRDDTRPFRVSPARDVFAEGEPVEFTAEVYDATNRPVQDAEISVSVRAGQTRAAVGLQAIGHGRYVGRIDGLPEGDYGYEGRATDGRADLGTDAGRFIVGGMDVEFRDTRMNRTVLQEIATATGGAFFPVDQFDRAIDSVRALPSFVPTPVRDDRRFDLWTMPALIAVIVALLSLEWYLRKRSGML